MNGAINSAIKIPVVLKIKAKKNQKVAIPLLYEKDDASSGLRQNEQEFILPRDIKLRINKVYDRGNYEEAEVSIV